MLDTGVDYTHPGLGGCFGPGCKVSGGFDLVGSNWTGTDDTLAPGPDPVSLGCSTCHDTLAPGPDPVSRGALLTEYTCHTCVSGCGL